MQPPVNATNGKVRDALARRAVKARRRGGITPPPAPVPEQRIGRNELAFFPKGMHHVITEASDVNRLCVLMIPGFLGEVPSEKL